MNNDDTQRSTQTALMRLKNELTKNDDKLQLNRKNTKTHQRHCDDKMQRAHLFRPTNHKHFFFLFLTTFWIKFTNKNWLNLKLSTGLPPSVSSERDTGRGILSDGGDSKLRRVQLSHDD